MENPPTEQVRRLAPGDPVPAGLPSRQAWLGQHFCHLYYGIEHLAVNAGSFAAAGLMNREMVAAYAREEARAWIERTMSLLGCDIEAARASGQFLWLDADEVLRGYRSTTKDDLLAFYGDLCRKAEQGGWVSLRIFGQTDILLDHMDWASVLKLERLVTEVIGNLPMTALCEYEFTPDVVRRQELTAAHPFLLLSACNWVDTSWLNTPR